MAISIERARERFNSVINLAMRPGTTDEGNAAWEIAENLSKKYGFQMPSREEVKADRPETKESREWAVKEVSRILKYEDTHIMKELAYYYNVVNGADKMKVVKEGKKIVGYSVSGLPFQIYTMNRLCGYYARYEHIAFLKYRKVYGSYTRGFREDFRNKVRMGFELNSLDQTNDYTKVATMIGMHIKHCLSQKGL